MADDRPTETPPGEGSTPMSLSEQGNSNTGDQAGSDRKPMVLTLGVMGVVIAVMVVAAIVGVIMTLG